MDEILLKQLLRQVKILNFWISVVGVLVLVSLAICGFLLFKVVTFVQDTRDSVNNLQQRTEDTLNVRKQICESDSVGSLFQDRSDLCKQ